MRPTPTRLRQLACVAACAALGAGPALAQPDARAALAEQAMHWQSLGRLELAEASWRKLLSADPQSADALYGMAQVELARGRPAQAQDWIARLRAAHPADARAARLEARLRQPGGPATDLQAARAAARAGRTEEALQAYRAIFGNRPPPEPIALEYYQLLAGTPQGWDESRRGLEQLARSRPDRQDVRLALAQLQTYRDATRREGIRSLAELARLPNGSAAREAWRQALLWLDARPADAALYRDYLSMQSDPAVAQRLDGLGTARAPQATEGPAAPDPLRLGFAAFERGDLGAAERHFRAALRQRPTHADALGGLGLVRLRQQQFAQAEDLLTQASRSGNGRRWSAALRSATYWNLVGQASAARERGDLASARQLLERAIQLDPAQPAARGALAGLADMRAAQARAQARREADAGDSAGARRTLEAALAEAPGNPWLRYDLALVYRRMDLPSEAHALMEAMPAAQRDTPDALHAQALLAADAGDPAAGMAYLDRIPDASRTADMNALRQKLQSTAEARRADLDRQQAELEARQATERRAEAERAPQLAAGTVYRHRSGEPGLGRLSDVQTPIEAHLPAGEGRIVLGVTPTELRAGTLGVDAGSASRFGGGMWAAQRQAAGLAPPPGEQRAQGVGLHVGYEDANFSASLGTTPQGFEHSNVVGHLAYSGRLGETVSFKAELSRRPVTDSLLSFAGTRDPRTGLRWGGVVATGGRLDLARDFGSWGVYGRGAVHSITGLHVEDNRRHALGGGVYLPLSRGPDGGLTVGLDVGLISYDKNLGGFTYGQGGYFSPQRHASLTLPIDWQGRDGRLSWRLNASIGMQSFREDPAPLSLLTGAAAFTAGTRHTGLAYNLAAVLEYRLAPQLYLGGALGFNNARDYRQFTGHAYLRYVFGAGAAQDMPSVPRLLNSPYTPLFP
ncbi:hypothetical protein GCM10023165_45690 [Variovorax defluvii]|uniref:Cellulose synthase operon C C-terminal domain-containing protein n=1 Tax=Variovorax defluvii TaxID=913761 RepID=A0ABP8IAF3_9BURK